MSHLKSTQTLRPFFWNTKCELANVLTPLCQQKNNSEIYFAPVRSCSTCSHVVCPSGVNILVYLLNILKWNNRKCTFIIITIKKGCSMHCPYITFSYVLIKTSYKKWWTSVSEISLFIVFQSHFFHFKNFWIFFFHWTISIQKTNFCFRFFWYLTIVY